MIYVLRVYIEFPYTFKIFSNFFKASAWYKMLYNATNCAPTVSFAVRFLYSLPPWHICSYAQNALRNEKVFGKLKNDLLISAEFSKRAVSNF